MNIFKGMSDWTIKLALWFLAGMSISVLVGIEFFNECNTKKLSARLHDVGRVQIPVVRSMTLADMMYDGLRAVVYRAILASHTKDEKELSAAKSEFAEFTKNISEYVTAIEKAPIDPETIRLSEEANQEISRYVAAGAEVIKLADQGQVEAAIKSLPEYQEKFEALETKLQKLGDRIEKNAEKSVEESEKASAEAEKWGVIIAGIGALLSLFFSLVVNKNISARLAKVSGVLGEGANEVGIAVTELSNASTDLSSSATQQSSALEQTASAINEISTMVKKSSELAQGAEHSANRSRERAESGTNIISEMVESMKLINLKTEELATQTNDSNEKIYSIVKVIDEVVQKTQVINEIVFQTKLLSFNASVEAARAGENGKGFAIVAEEVGNLAQMSGTAAKEINLLLEESRSTVSRIVSESKSKVEASLVSAKEAVLVGDEKAEKCGEVFHEIAKDSSQLFDLVSNISQASEESSKGVEEISRTLSDLSSATQSNAGAANHCAEASYKLEDQVIKLRDSANQLNRLVDGVDLINKFEWKDSYALGVHRMDDEHKILIGKINVLAEALSSNLNVFQSFQELANYTHEHFSDEEAYMQSIQYPDLEAHKKIHANVLLKVGQFGEEIRRGQANSGEIMSFLNDWLLKHILGVDMKYARHSRGVGQTRFDSESTRLSA